MYGASGYTLEEIKYALKYTGIPDEDLERNVKHLTEKFGTDEETLANKIYLMKTCSLNPKIKSIGTKSLHSEIELVDFDKNVETADKINDWVASKTENNVKDIISPKDLNATTKLVLVNSIHFKGAWEEPFDSASTFKGPFYINEKESVQTEFMTKKAKFYYNEVEDLDVTELLMDYRKSDVSMLIILPNSRTGLPELEKKLTKFSIRKHLDQMMTTTMVQVKIPKFRIEYQVDLEEPLKKVSFLGL